MSCPARHALPPSTGKWWASEGLGGELSCVLEEGHAGAHLDPDGRSWQFVPKGFAGLDPLHFEIGPLAFLAGLDHPNCSCALPPMLPTIDSSIQLPEFWVREALEENFGPTSPRLFHPLESGTWKPPF